MWWPTCWTPLFAPGVLLPEVDAPLPLQGRVDRGGVGWERGSSSPWEKQGRTPAPGAEATCCALLALPRGEMGQELPCGGSAGLAATSGPPGREAETLQLGLGAPQQAGVQAQSGH